MLGPGSLTSPQFYRGNDPADMSPYVQMFLFLFKSKYRRKCDINCIVLYLVIVYSSVFNIVYSSKCSDEQCINGDCVNGTCVCFDGWRGPSCQWCTGKVKLSATSGYIYDGLGNYSIDVKCSWLIDGSAVPNASIRLHIDEFATECGWDYLYIYDGDSVHSPLLGVFSGLMYKGDYSVRRVPEVVAHSGYALIHFYSDVAYNMSGFNISYRLNSCPSRLAGRNCSGNGVCIDGVCTCDAMYTGEACDLLICPNNCSYSNGECARDQHRCLCGPKYKGEDCSQVGDLGYWEVIRPRGILPNGSASHTASVWRDSLHIIGGESYGTAGMIYTYDFTGNVWETYHHSTDSKTTPTPRYGHSAVIFGDKIYIYGGVKSGGVVCNELWAFDVSAKSWENITVRAEPCNSSSLCGPLKSAGHTATLVTSKRSIEKMIVIFGHSPTYGYLNTVQEYHFGTREWSIVKTHGFPVKARYGHSAAWDPLTEQIYVYGGYTSEAPASPLLSNRLYSYNPSRREWTLLSSAPSARFLHTATFLDGLMIVFGGNAHNDTSSSSGAKCYSAEALTYDVACDSWATLQLPTQLRADIARFGHSSAVFNSSLYIYGGFNGQMLNDILKYTGGSCYNLTLPMCLNTRPGVKCVWEKKIRQCVPITEVSKAILVDTHWDKDEAYYVRCPGERRSSIAANIMACSQLEDCVSCVHTSLGCGWCPHANVCSHDIVCKKLVPNSQAFTTERAVTLGSECPVVKGASCHVYHSCQTCSVQPDCVWTTYEHCVANDSLVEGPEQPVQKCGPICSELNSCLNCTNEECIWCHNEGRCVDKTAYTASFPYGQCREWTTIQTRCPVSPGESACMSHKWCSECRDAPECGWCDDGTGTGKGVCLQGGNNPPSNCPKKHWYFTHCPSCQCNGHSTCKNNSSVCVQPCGNLTTGDHCETCIPGYYGSPVNGGNCTRCECNNHGTHCFPDTGKCHCTTKGIIGDHCEKCDTQNHYHGDPTNHGSCFYDLTIDYQFTFNLSKKDDRHYTQINFKNSPPKADIDADFSITCSVLAKMNITIKTVNQPEKPLLTGHNCSNFRTRFNKNDHSFGVVDNVTLTTFFVYVYDFQTPLWIQISFSQYPKLNLQQFFITFSSCFLLLLLVAAVLWKIKQKYDMYRRRQRLFVEMEQMASRPFSQVLVEIEKRDSTTPTTNSKKKQECPSPIALEPCSGNRAAVLSLLVRLPTGGASYTPHGQSAGLAIASALVTLGNPRKVSIEAVTKNDGKSKSRKTVSSQHPDSCI